MSMSMPMERYHFQRANKSDLIRVFNRNSCLMAEYREQTGKVSWQRLVGIQQRTAVEERLHEQFPAKLQALKQPSGQRRKAHRKERRPRCPGAAGRGGTGTSWLRNHARSAGTGPLARVWGMRIISTAAFVRFGSRSVRLPTLLRAPTSRLCFAMFASEWRRVERGHESIARPCRRLRQKPRGLTSENFGQRRRIRRGFAY
jgi:hypothetical protein